jgi:hypothetical protein
MVIDPRSHVALMREPRVFVAGRYFEWIACIVLWASIARAAYGVAPIGCPGDSRYGFNEMPLSGTVGRDENGTDTRTGARACLTIDAGGPVAIAGA